MAHHWGYGRQNGPHTWSHVAPAAKGLHQSPVDIDTSNAQYDPRLEDRPLEIHYIPENSKTLVNNGHSVQVTINGAGSILEGGPFRHRYQVEQFHFHWGRRHNKGSEHRIDGESYAAELHIVHWNTELAANFAEASKTANGLAVLGAFLKVGRENQALQHLIEHFPRITFSGNQTSLPDGFDPASLLPHDRTRYWTYNGSLTTPPCYESVRFLIFQKPVEVSEHQLEAFRQLHSHPAVKGEAAAAASADEFGGKLFDNFRPTLPLNDRKIIASFF